MSFIGFIVHDVHLLHRSTGYGSLQIWIHYLKSGITFQPQYAGRCKNTGWNGATITIGGGYTFEDVYPLAAANNVVVVGGGTPVSDTSHPSSHCLTIGSGALTNLQSVGALGGWLQGGGHGPAAHNFGLGADQLLEAQVYQ